MFAPLAAVLVWADRKLNIGGCGGIVAYIANWEFN
jgi:hypothetical protein